MPGTLVQVNVSNGGMPKHPVLQARVTFAGVEGDRQKNTKVHGGPNRAVCIYSEELYQFLRDKGVNVTNGQVGENFTTRGLDLNALKPGDRLRVGACTIEITKVRVPCHQLRMWDPDLPELIVGHSGWVAKVIEEGIVRRGDAIQVLVEKSALSPSPGGRGKSPKPSVPTSCPNPHLFKDLTRPCHRPVIRYTLRFFKF